MDLVSTSKINIQDPAKLQALQSEIKNIFISANIINVNKRFTDEKIDNHKCYHYQTSINKANFTNAINQSINKIINDTADSDPAIKDLLKNDEINKNIEKFVNSIVNDTGEVWIDKKDYYLRKSNFIIDFDFSKMSSDVPAGTSVMHVIIGSTFNNFNNTANIIKPAESISIIQLFEELFGGISDQLKEAKVKSRDAQRNSDMRYISTSIELERADSKDDSYLTVLTDDQCATPGTVISNCKFKDISISFKDPNKEIQGKPCSKNGEPCDYTLITAPTKDDYEICFYLEKGTGKLPAGMHHVDKSGLGEGCSVYDNDYDKDNLLNYEEENIYFTDPNNSDTDKDTYKDGDEIRSGYNPNGDGKIFVDFSTPESALYILEKDSLNNKNIDLFIEKIYFSDEFIKNLKSKLNWTKEEFVEMFKELALDELKDKQIDIINITKKEKINDNEVKLDYIIKYKVNKNGIIPPPKADSSFFIKSNNEWLINPDPEFKEIFSNPYQMEMMKNL